MFSSVDSIVIGSSNGSSSPSSFSRLTILSFCFLFCCSVTTSSYFFACPGGSDFPEVVSPSVESSEESFWESFWSEEELSDGLDVLAELFFAFDGLELSDESDFDLL